MGHSRLGSLPKTRKWNDVVGLIDYGASAAQTANATIRAAELGFMKASNDDLVVESIRTLMQLPMAAKNDNYVEALRHLGIKVSQPPTIMELSAAITEKLDTQFGNVGKRTNLGEMAQNALAESVCATLKEGVPSLFASNPNDVRVALSNNNTDKNFGKLSRNFFSKLTNKYLNYYLSKTLPNHVGEGRRFSTLSQVQTFEKAIDTHCFEAAKIVETFSSDWRSKTNYQQKGLPTDEVKKFTYGAMSKLLSELKEGTK